jgi:hypothetical protein
LTRSDIINLLIGHRQYRSYLEIGVAAQGNLRRVQCEQKLGVDPAVCAPGVLQMESDSFFAQSTGSFDLIFIDGSHEEAQVDRDVVNSLERLNPEGAIVIHDCLPPSEWHQRPVGEFRPGQDWTGTVWRSVLKYFAVSPWLCYVVDCDWGCGVIDTRYSAQAKQLRALPAKLDYERDFRLLREYLRSAAEFLTQFQEP